MTSKNEYVAWCIIILLIFGIITYNKSINNVLDDKKEEIFFLNKNINILSSDVFSLQSNISNMDQKLTSLYMDIDNLQNNITNKNKEILFLNNEIVNLNTLLYPPAPPANIKNVTNVKIYQIILEQLGTPTYCLLTDEYYFLTSIEEYNRFLSWDDTFDLNKYPYQKNIFDCDDYAFRMYGNFRRNNNWSAFATGVVVWQEPSHAEPFLIDDEEKVWLILSQERLSHPENVNRTGLVSVII